MKICQRCLYHEHHPLNLCFDQDQICSGCRIHEEKDIIDWSEKSEMLENLLLRYKNSSGNNYDCIIPVSGGKDSYFIVHTIKNVYKLNPLLVSYNKHYNTDIGARNLANLRIQFDCDLMTFTVNPETVKKVTRGTFRRFGSIYWHCIAGQTVFPVQIAVKMKIPLIIWGAHQGIDQVGMFSHHDHVEMSRKYRKEHDLMGYEAEDLIDTFDEITFEDIRPWIYPSSEEISKVGVRGIYLNNYLRWDSKAQHEKMILSYQYETTEQTRTFDFFNDIDCYNYSDVHDYIKWIKHGYGKITDHVNREIRLKRLNRQDGLELIRKFQNREPKNLDLFLKWIGMTKNGFNYILNQHRNPLFWERDENWIWKFKDPLIDAMDNTEANQKHALEIVESNCHFQLTPTKTSTDPKDQYLLMYKGRGLL
jgi:N-acetyl sugar amidotransferase